MKKLRIIALCLIMVFAFSTVASAQVQMPYTNHTYSESDSSAVAGPQAYIAEKTVYGNDLGIGSFTDCNDIFTDKNGTLYILDSGNNRVVIVNSDLTLNRVHTVSFTDQNGQAITIEGAQGIFADEDYIYICDTEHSRILITALADGALVKIVNAPESTILGEDFIFKPRRLVADSEKDLYVVSNGTYEGIINMDLDGNFICFFASNKVTTSSWDLFWRRFSSKEQREAMEQLIPQSFSSIDIDQSGFFFVTTYNAYDDSMVKRINPGGNNVIREMSNVPITGDPKKYANGSLAGNSSFADVAVGNYKIYACLDITRGKIFCYNNDGYLLYTFGTLSSQFGGFNRPVALAYTTGDRIAVLDAGSLSFTVFAPTKYGKAINSGTNYQNLLEYNSAIEQWEKVLSLNENFQLAQNMIGKAYLSDGDYETAMQYFKSAENKDMYSQAKSALRTEWIHSNIKWMLIVAIALITLVTVAVKINKKKSGGKGLAEDE